MMKSSLIALAWAALAGVVSPAYSEDEKKEVTAASTDDHDASTVGTGSASRIVLQAGDADSKATARLAGRFGGNGDIDGRYALTVTAPFDSDKADRVDVGTLSGLTAGTSATLEFGLRHWGTPSEQQQRDMTAVCEKYIPLLIPGYSLADAEETAAAVCDDYALEEGQIKELIDRINKRRKSCANCLAQQGADPPLCETLRSAQQQSCVPKSPNTAATADPATCALLEKSMREECAACKKTPPGDEVACKTLARHEPAALPKDEKLRKRLFAEAQRAAQAPAENLFRPLTIYTVGLTANTQRFSYFLEDNLDEVNKRDKRGAAITFAATHVLLRSAWILGYSHEESYKGSDKIQLCRPLGTTGASTCTAASLGAPKKEKAEIAFLQNRVGFAAGRFALAPRVEFDFKESEWAARVPFYFIANKANELTAGVAVGYTEVDDEGFGATVFISKAFTFY